jgi:putative glutathione S-transferase
MIVRALKGLDPHISVSVVHPDMLADGWTFATDFPAPPATRSTARPPCATSTSGRPPRDHQGHRPRPLGPRARDHRLQRILRDHPHDDLRLGRPHRQRLDLWPADLREALEPVNARIYDTVNNGVYRAGFASTQEPTTAPSAPSSRRSTGSRSACRAGAGSWATASRKRHPPLHHAGPLRHGLSRPLQVQPPQARRVSEPLGLHPRRLPDPGVAPTVHLDHIARHYHYSHGGLNPTRIVPIGPDLDLQAPHGRETLGRPAAA